MRKNAIGKVATAKTIEVLCVQSGKPAKKASDEKLKTR
jgi:hypothetical protein